MGRLFKSSLFTGAWRRTLPKEKFRNYLIEDYLYLQEYAKVFAVGLIKSKSMEEIKFHYKVIQGILKDENAVHIKYLKYLGVNIESLDEEQSSIENSSYTDYMLKVAKEGNLKAMAIVIMPCTWSYFYIAKDLKEKYKSKLSNNYYREWIESYSSQGYKSLMEAWKVYIDNICCNLEQFEAENLLFIFKEASLYEKGFWDMAYRNKEHMILN